MYVNRVHVLDLYACCAVFRNSVKGGAGLRFQEIRGSKLSESSEGGADVLPPKCTPVM